MNTMLNNGLKVLACGAAALAITTVFSLSFVQATAVVHNDGYVPVPWTAELAMQPMQPGHTFGQPEPAVLVD
jgi:hypothetical protein